jgi:hypothetical protein
MNMGYAQWGRRGQTVGETRLPHLEVPEEQGLVGTDVGQGACERWGCEQPGASHKWPSLDQGWLK